MRTNHGWQKVYAAGWIISAGVMVVTARIWQLHLKEVEQRAEEAERTRDEVGRRKAVEERLRIARELHDSLTHSISVIQVQAGVAVHLARKRGEEVPPESCGRRSACCVPRMTPTAAGSVTWTDWSRGRVRPGCR
jgi:signal transduction histidine kinase